MRGGMFANHLGLSLHTVSASDVTATILAVSDMAATILLADAALSNLSTDMDFRHRHKTNRTEHMNRAVHPMRPLPNAASSLLPHFSDSPMSRRVLAA